MEWSRFKQMCEEKLSVALKADHGDAPFPMSEIEAVSYHRTRADLLGWVLDMWPTVPLKPRSQPPARDDAQPVACLDAAQKKAAERAAMDAGAYSWRNARLAMVEGDKVIGYPAFSRADMAELARLHTHPAPDALRAAVSDIAAERQRQVDAEGWSDDRDDGYADAELAKSAAAYTLSACGFSPDAAREMWPRSWSVRWWKPTTPRRDLVKAGALIAAEIERLDRAALQAEQKGGA